MGRSNVAFIVAEGGRLSFHDATFDAALLPFHAETLGDPASVVAGPIWSFGSNIKHRQCEAVHTCSEIGELFVLRRSDSSLRACRQWRAPCQGLTFAAGACCGLSSTSARARRAFGLERIERLLISCAAVRQPRLRRLVSLLSVGEYAGGRQGIELGGR